MTRKTIDLSTAYQVSVAALSIASFVGLLALALYKSPAAYAAIQAGGSIHAHPATLPLAVTAAAVAVFSIGRARRVK